MSKAFLGVDENNQPYCSNEDCYIHVYDFNREDIVLNRVQDFINIQSESVIVSIGNIVCKLPTNTHIVIADMFYDMVDSVMILETLGMEFSTPLWDDDFIKAKLKPIQILGIEQEKTTYTIPNTTKPFFVKIGENANILITRTDVSNKLCKLSYFDLVVHA